MPYLVCTVSVRAENSRQYKSTLAIDVSIS
jgi:hypothetical protein